MSVIVAIVLWLISAVTIFASGTLFEAKKHDSAAIGTVFGLLIGACALWVIA